MKTLDLGRVEYLAAWDRQREIVDDVREGGEDTLVFVEHPPVLTLGASFHEENLLHPPEEYMQRGIALHRTDRGGDVTYHGPGQLVVYPIFNLDRHGRDLHAWLRGLEEAIIVTCSVYGVEARRFPPHTGVWVEDRKIAAIGIKVKRWVSMHGIALNCDNDLAVFDSFVPCGILGYGVTSLSECVGRPIGLANAKAEVERAFRLLFGS